MPKMKRLLMALALLPLMAAAETEIVDGIEWSYAINDGKVQIVGTGSYGEPAIPSSTTGAITIPQFLGGFPVMDIGKCAFYGCASVTSVELPKGVTSIGSSAFNRCSSLATIKIPAGVVNVGDSAFNHCKALQSIQVEEGNLSYCSVDGILYNGTRTVLVKCPDAKKGTVVIPSGVVTLEGDSFYTCHSLTSVSIPSSVVDIRGEPFYQCEKLSALSVDVNNPFFCSEDGILYNKGRTELLKCPEGKSGPVIVPAGVTSIRGRGFGLCERITSVSLPQGLVQIGGYEAFWDCDALTTIRIPAGVTEIGGAAFRECDNLLSIVIPSSVERIGWGIFEGSNKLKRVYVDEGDSDRMRNLIAESMKEAFPIWDPFDLENLQFIEGSPKENLIVPGESVSIDTGLIGYTASGLPSGLKYGKTTGMITGAATKPTAAGGVIVKFTKSGAETEEMTIVVGPTPKIGVALEGDTDGCKVTGAGAYLVGKTVTLKVTAPKGTAFVGFFKDGEPWPNEADCKKTSLAYAMGKEDVSLVAKFEKEKMSVGCAGLLGGSFTAGVAGSPEGIPLEIETQSGVKSVKVEKLPAGMKYDAKNERITGAPTKAGNSKVVITVTAVSGAVEKKEIDVPVAAMPETAVGTFNGFIANGERRIGTFSLTTTDAGRLTAKVITAAGTVSFSGTCWDSVEDGVYKVTLTTKKGERLSLTLDSNAAWDADQLSGAVTTAEIAETRNAAAVPSRTYSVSAQRNAFGKTWYFTAVGDEQTGWTFAYTKDVKAAALTVTLKADGSTAIAGKLPNGVDAKGKVVALKVSASGYANVGGMREGAIIADFAPVVTVNKAKRVLSIRANLWFDRLNDHDEGAGSAQMVK